MLRYNFTRILKARIIEKPYSYLLNAGFSNNFANKIVNNKVSRLNSKELEKLCLLLRTPTDLMEWIPDESQTVDNKHPLYEIIHTNKMADIAQTLSVVRPGQLDEIDELIKAWIEKQNGTQLE